MPDAEGVIHSEVFPGLRLLVSALLNDEQPAVIADLQSGLTSEGHAIFLQRINAKGQS